MCFLGFDLLPVFNIIPYRSTKNATMSTQIFTIRKKNRHPYTMRSPLSTPPPALEGSQIPNVSRKLNTQQQKISRERVGRGPLETCTNFQGLSTPWTLLPLCNKNANCTGLPRKFLGVVSIFRFNTTWHWPCEVSSSTVCANRFTHDLQPYLGAPAVEPVRN